jgi:hypothetical protein
VIHDRSVRHADDIAARKRELGGALAAVNAELWVTDKSERLALLQQVLEQYRAWFVDEEYDENLRRRVGRDIGFITHQIDDLMGDLPTRSQVELDVKGAIPLGDVLAMDEDGVFHAVQKAS